MRKIIASACMLVVLLAVASASAADWTKLGEKILSYRSDTETFTVKNDTAWKQLKLQVAKNSVTLVKLTVTFKDGTSFESALGAYVAAGDSSKTVDLPDAKAIAKVAVTIGKGSRERFASLSLMATS